MTRLELGLLGGFDARRDGASVKFRTRKAQALLAYLALPVGQGHPRDKLASLLWGDMAQPQARSGLRQALFSLRHTVGDEVLSLDGDRVALIPEAVNVDVDRFERCVAQATPEALAEAAGLYRGPLLQGLALSEPPFEAWLLAERDRLHERAMEALARLLQRQRADRLTERAIDTALKLVALDPLQEPVHRTLMRLYAEAGRRTAALRQYHLCARALERELRTEPEPETRALYQSILERRTKPAVVAAASAPAAPPPPPDEQPATESTMVGRQVELARLTEALEAAWAGHGRLVAILGEAGIGKSRLAAEIAALARQRGGRVVVGHAYETEQMLPFAPWIDAVRSAGVAHDGALLDSLGPVWRGELARIIPELGAVDAGVHPSDALTLFEAMAQLFERLAERQPLVVIIEDFHWADEISLRLLRVLGRRMARTRLLVVITAREEETALRPLQRRVGDDLVREGSLVRLGLSPLSREATVDLVRQLVAQHGGDHADASLEEAIWHSSEGHPFMVVETVRALADRAALHERDVLPLPARVRRLTMSRLERVSETARRLVDIATVIGREFDFALLQRAAQLPDDVATEGVEELVLRRILRQAGEGLAFSHDHIREIAYAELLGARRALLHRRVAETMESLHSGDIERHALALGRHYREAAVWTKAVEWFRVAGRRAATHLAPREAAACYQQALVALGHLSRDRAWQEEAAEMQVALGWYLQIGGDLDAAKSAYQEASPLVQAIGSDELAADLGVGRTSLLGSLGEHAAAVAVAEQSLPAARKLGTRVFEQLLCSMLSRECFALGDYARSEAWARSAPVVSSGAVKRPLTMSPVIAPRTWLALALARMGDYEAALDAGEHAMRMAEDSGGPTERVWASYTLARIYLGRGEFDRGRALLQDAVAMADHGRLPIYLPRVLSSLGVAHLAAGHETEALHLLERGDAEARAIRLTYGRAMIVVQLGDAYLARGRLDDAARAAEQALEITRAHGERGDEAWARHLAAGIAAARGETQAAASGFEETLALARHLRMRPLEARCHHALSAVWERAGRLDRARTRAAAAAGAFRALGMSFWLPDAERRLAQA